MGWKDWAAKSAPATHNFFVLGFFEHFIRSTTHSFDKQVAFAPNYRPNTPQEGRLLHSRPTSSHIAEKTHHNQPTQPSFLNHSHSHSGGFVVLQLCLQNWGGLDVQRRTNVVLNRGYIVRKILGAFYTDRLSSGPTGPFSAALH